MAMTPEEFATKMREINSDPDIDIEEGHCKADDLMCEVLRSLGYGEGVQIFDAMERWYA